MLSPQTLSLRCLQRGLPYLWPRSRRPMRRQLRDNASDLPLSQIEIYTCPSAMQRRNVRHSPVNCTRVLRKGWNVSVQSNVDSQVHVLPGAVAVLACLSVYLPYGLTSRQIGWADLNSNSRHLARFLLHRNFGFQTSNSCIYRTPGISHSPRS